MCLFLSRSLVKPHHRCVIMYEVVDETLPKLCHYQQNVPQHYYLLDTLVHKNNSQLRLDCNSTEETHCYSRSQTDTLKVNHCLTEEMNFSFVIIISLQAKILTLRFEASFKHHVITPQILYSSVAAKVNPKTEKIKSVEKNYSNDILK